MTDELAAHAGRPLPDLANAVLGFRGWKVAPSGLLMSAGVSDGWLPGENAAACSRGLHPAPSKGCGCGLYAHYSLEDLTKSVHWGDETGIIVGAVAGWGRVILHPDGWRAESAAIMALFRQGPAAALERAAKVYSVPIVAGPMELDRLDIEAEPVKDAMKPEPEGPEADGQLGGGGGMVGGFATGGVIPGGGATAMAVGTMMPRRGE